MKFDLIDLIKKIEVRYRCAIISAFVIGIFSQGMGLFNKYSVHDDVMNYGVGATYTSGRWMLDILSICENLFYGDGHYSLPVNNGFLAIFLIALSACLVVKTLDIRNAFLCSFISGLMVCFPVITSIFGYMFTLHCYMMALFLGTLGAYCICRYEKWQFILVGIAFSGASVGIYQAFIPTIITIILLYLIDYVSKCNDIKKIARKVCICGISCILFMLFYFVANKIYLFMNHAELSNYKGIDSMGQSSVSEYMQRVVDAYKAFVIPNTQTQYYMYPGNIFNVYRLVIIVSIGLSILTFARLINENRIRAIVFAVLIGLIPLCVNFIFIMTGKDEIHSLMVYSQLMPFVFFAWVVDNMHRDKEYLTKGLSCFAAILMISLILMYSRVDNKCYLKATYAQQEAISFFTTLVSQIKETDGYKDEYPVAFINARKVTDESLKSGDDGALENIYYAPYNYNVVGLANNYMWFEFMEQWTGYSPSLADENAFTEMEEVIKMTSYPDDGSIRIIDETIVIKF